MTLAEIRMAFGASGVADSIRRALAVHGTVTAAAASLSTTPFGLRRAARRAGLTLEERPRTPGSAGWKRAKTPARKTRENEAK